MQCEQTLSACIVTYNNADKISTVVSSIKRYTNDVDYKLYISDNGSSDSTVDNALAADKDAVILKNGSNLGFGKAHNVCIPYLNSKYHAVINPDIEIKSNVLPALCRYLDEHGDVVMVTPKMLYPDGREQVLPKRKPSLKYLLGRRLPVFKKAVNEYTMSDIVIDKPIQIEFCTGCFFVIRTDIFKKLGGFDDRFFMYFEDADLTLRASEYGKAIFLPEYSVIHSWERSSSKSIKYLLIHIISMLKFLIKHRKRRKK